MVGQLELQSDDARERRWAGLMDDETAVKTAGLSDNSKVARWGWQWAAQSDQWTAGKKGFARAGSKAEIKAALRAASSVDRKAVHSADWRAFLTVEPSDCQLAELTERPWAQSMAD